jgi:general secretion pathway protein C
MARYFSIIQLALIVAMTYFGTFIFYRVLTEKLETVPVFQASREKQVITPTQPSEKNTGSFKQYQTAIDRNLFKATSTEPVEKDEKVDVKTLEQTQLGLKLWGTVYGMAGKTYAVIEETATRKQRLFSIGDEVQSASVEMILREKVVLKGRKRYLKLKNRLAGGGVFRQNERAHRQRQLRRSQEPKAKKKWSFNAVELMMPSKMSIN